MKGNSEVDVEEDQFLSGFGCYPDAMESNEIDPKSDEIEAQGVCISEQGVGGCSQAEEIDYPGT